MHSMPEEHHPVDGGVRQGGQAYLHVGRRLQCVLGWPEPFIYRVYTVFLAGKSPNIQSHTMRLRYIYGSG